MIRAAVAIGLAAASVTAGADASTPAGAVRGPAQVRVTGLVADPGGVSVGDAGDLNGDGRRDLVIGLPGRDVFGREDAGTAFVVYGAPRRRRVDAAGLGRTGFRILGPPSVLPAEDFDDDSPPFGDSAGADVAGVGDVNGDGLDDVALSAPQSGAGLRQGGGSVYVVFGSRTGGDVDLATLGDRGFRIDGDRVADGLEQVARAGDVDGDGLDDVAISSLRSGAYVVAGRRSTSTVDLRTLGGQGFRIHRASERGDSRLTVAGIGDSDRDGLADLAVGDPAASPGGRARAGSVWMIRGARSRATLVLGATGGRAHRFDGPTRERAVGSAVAPAGDFDRDGRADVIAGAVGDDDLELLSPQDGRAYVLFGGAPPGLHTNLGAAGRRFTTLVGPRGEESFGSAVSSAGDVTGDHRDDVAAGAPQSDHGCQSGAGAVYVVAGGRRRRRVDLTLRRPSPDWHRVVGARSGAGAGSGLAAAGPGLIVSAPGLGTRPSVDSIRAVRSERSTAVPSRRGCLRISSPARDLRRVVRAGALPLKLTVREGRPVFDSVDVSATLVVPGRGQRNDVALADRGFAARTGARRLRLRLSKRARSALRRRPSAVIRLSATQEGLGNMRSAGARVRLAR